MPAARPTTAAIRRAIEAMQAAGLSVGGSRVMRDGSVVILVGAANDGLPSPDSGVDEWDRATGTAL